MNTICKVLENVLFDFRTDFVKILDNCPIFEQISNFQTNVRFSNWFCQIFRQKSHFRTDFQSSIVQHRRQIMSRTNSAIFFCLAKVVNLTSLLGRHFDVVALSNAATVLTINDVDKFYDLFDWSLSCSFIKQVPFYK